MSLIQDVNTELLNQCFELGPFHGLHKPHDDDVTEAPKSPTPPPSSRRGSERPDSAQSIGSRSSKGTRASKTSKASGDNISSGNLEPPGSNGRPTSRINSGSSIGRQSNQGSIAEEPRVKQKLTNGDDSQSILSDNADVESLQSEANDRSLQETPPPESQAAGAIDAVTPLPPSQRGKPSKRFVPTYKGDPTVFSIQLFCIDERYEMRSCDFLSKAFELFPDCDFCAITVPHLVPEFPLLQQFVRITPRVPSTLSQELYVFGRAGLLRGFQVRGARDEDVAGVENLVKSLDLNENLLSDLKQYNKAKRDDDGVEIQTFVATCHDQVVGIAVVRMEEDIEYIRSHYNIEDFIYFNHHRREEHGHLHHYALNPVFKHYSKTFLKEVLRLGKKSCLYYPLYPGYSEKKILEKHTLVAALNDMVPVRARRQISYPLEALRGNAPSSRVLELQEKYALNHINRKLTLEPKVTINARIVVVGASDVGIAFLETFAFCPHLRFNNLTMISPHGLPGELPPDTLRDQMMVSSQCYTQEDYAQMALRAWVNVVYGKMTAIDRKRKHVVVNYATVVPYDHLVIATGTQYQIPAPTEADVDQLITSNEIENSPDRRFSGMPPKNVFVINDAYESAVALYWVENSFLKSDGKAVIYGCTIDCYSCVQTLVAMGVPGDRICIVEPPHEYETTCLNNSNMDKVLEGALKDLGVTIFTGYLLAQWNEGQEAEHIESVSFTSETKPLKLDAMAFFSYYKKQVDFEAFKAINDSCLVFDGRLVIDASFHTTDVAIRGAGPITKFQRSYHADKWTHANFNSKEVGLQLASSMLSLFDPTLEPEPEPPSDLLKLIPMYRSPKVQYTMLPGGYYYLHVSKPGLNTSLDAQMAQVDYGRELITGTPGGDPEYFRLHINQYSTVETITCCSKQPFEVSNIICLFGLHERYLNNLVSRFDEKLISDFYSYFNETWSLALFHDRFPDFRDEVRELLVTRPSEDVEALEEKVRQLIEEDLTMNDNQRKSIKASYAESGAKRAVETRLLSFLSYNYYHLPMYAKPGMV